MKTYLHLCTWGFVAVFTCAECLHSTALHMCISCHVQANKIKSDISFKFWVPQIEIFAAGSLCSHMSSGISATFKCNKNWVQCL
jgi:hypothetical protein